MTVFYNLLGKRCQDKVTGKIGICTEVRKSLYGGEKYLLESDGIDTFEPVLIDVYRLKELDVEEDEHKAKLSDSLMEELKDKRGQIFRR